MAQFQTISALARDACQGNSEAKALLRQKLEKGLAVIVKRTLKSGKAANPLSRQIIQEIRRIVQRDNPPTQHLPVHIITEVSKRICETLLSRLDSAFLANPLLETVANTA